MPNSPPSGARVPACSAAEDHIIRCEELAFIREQLADLACRVLQAKEQAQDLGERRRVAGIGSPEWTRLSHDYGALCDRRSTLWEAWSYWSREYRVLQRERHHRLRVSFALD